MSDCCHLWNLEFKDSSPMNATFSSDIRPVIGGGTNYENLSNKPAINGVTLIGNKTNEELDIKAISNSEIEVLLKSFV